MRPCVIGCNTFSLEDSNIISLLSTILVTQNGVLCSAKFTLCIGLTLILVDKDSNTAGLQERIVTQWLKMRLAKKMLPSVMGR